MKIEESTVTEERAESMLDEKVVKLFIRQLVHEMYNHNLYLSFASYYARKGLEVLAEYYKQRAAEEKLHHDWIYNFLNDCDVEYVYPEIPEIKETWDDLETPFKLTVDQELLTTSMIYEIADEAKEQGDWISLQFLLSDDEERGALIREQHEEESISKTLLDIAKTEGSWINKQKVIMETYKGSDD